MRFFDNAALVTSELNLLHGRYPNEYAILLRLLEQRIAQKNYDVAMALADKLISKSNYELHTAYLGLGYMLKGKIYHLRDAPKLATQFYIEAHNILSTRNLLQLQSMVSKNEAWLGFYNENYAQVSASLYQAASQARLANEPLAEIEAYTLQSILASKMRLDKEKYYFLHKAELLLANYGLNQSNYADLLSFCSLF